MAESIVKYVLPSAWINYDERAISSELVRAKSAILSLQNMPYQRSWIEDLQEIELKREIDGTSRIEGADFTEREFEDALKEPPETLITRSQKQARAALETYNWISTVPRDRPVDESLVLNIHRKIVFGADDDHCDPGKLRTEEQNVNFGRPRHRGASGGEECATAFGQFVNALKTEYMDHDPVIQALAAHFHLAAMHPFLDGNGRTSRALEALLLQRAGVMDVCFVPMSNYYYDEKPKYLAALAVVHTLNHDLTPFLKFALRGIHIQITRILKDVQTHVSKALFLNLSHELFDRLKSKRNRLVPKRQLAILTTLLRVDTIEYDQLYDSLFHQYYSILKSPAKAFLRDLSALVNLKAIDFEKTEDGDWIFWPRLQWPTEITETAFYQKMKEFPKAKTSL